mmetsp:Transcript_10270/g.24677  ORF Transcript_10270/g.24677 Transcript_10270/m.24677 type:complete len:291 (-) Transcript_10270:592-1464(-)
MPYVRHVHDVLLKLVLVNLLSVCAALNEPGHIIHLLFMPRHVGREDDLDDPSPQRSDRRTGHVVFQQVSSPRAHKLEGCCQVEILEDCGVVVPQCKIRLGLDEEVIVGRWMANVVYGCSHQHNQQIHLLKVALEAALMQVGPNLVRHQRHLCSMGAVVVRIRLDVAILHSSDVLMNFRPLCLRKEAHVRLRPNGGEDLEKRFEVGLLQLDHIHTVPNVDLQFDWGVFLFHAPIEFHTSLKLVGGVNEFTPSSDYFRCPYLGGHLPDNVAQASEAAVPHAEVSRLHHGFVH